MLKWLLIILLAACASVTPSTSAGLSPLMVQITPNYPVVRSGKVLPAKSSVSFSAQFLAQQKKAFGENLADEYNRMLRYELGKIAYHEPIASFGSVSETFSSTPDPSKIEFGQSAVTDLFGDSGKSATTVVVEIGGKEVKRGKTLSQDVADLQSGAMHPDDLPIHVFQYVDLDGVAHWVTENNRHLTVLRMAKKNPTKILLLKKTDLEKKQGDNSLLSILNRLKALPNCKPSSEMFIRIDGVNDIGEPRNSWDWDAPFGSVVR